MRLYLRLKVGFSGFERGLGGLEMLVCRVELSTALSSDHELFELFPGCFDVCSI